MQLKRDGGKEGRSTEAHHKNEKTQKNFRKSLSSSLPGSKEAPFAAINGITTLAYYTKKNVATPQVSP